MIARAIKASDQAVARDLWTRIDEAIVDHAPLVPLLNPRSIRFLSERLENFQYSQGSGLLLEQMWVR